MNQPKKGNVMDILILQDAMNQTCGGSGGDAEWDETTQEWAWSFSIPD